MLTLSKILGIKASELSFNESANKAIANGSFNKLITDALAVSLADIELPRKVLDKKGFIPENLSYKTALTFVTVAIGHLMATKGDKPITKKATAKIYLLVDLLAYAHGVNENFTPYTGALPVETVTTAKPALTALDKAIKVFKALTPSEVVQFRRHLGL